MLSNFLSSDVLDEFSKMYTFRKYLGKGAFSVVLEAQDKQTYELVALKIIEKSKTNIKLLHSLQSEISILQSLSHPNIITLLHVKETDLALYIATEIMKGGSLAQLIIHNRECNTFLCERECSIIIRSILRAINQIHSQGITHRDIKPDNIMLPNGDLESLKIVDFGLSSKLSYYTNEKCGTPIYMAPELLEGKIYSHTVDIWAVGVIMYELLTNQHPYYQNGEKCHNFLEKIKLKNMALPSNCSPMASSLLSKLIAFDPENRYFAHQALLHPWITGENMQNIPLTYTEEMENTRNIGTWKKVINAMLFIGRKMNHDNLQEYEEIAINGSPRVKIMAPPYSKSNSTEESEKSIVSELRLDNVFLAKLKGYTFDTSNKYCTPNRKYSEATKIVSGTIVSYSPPKQSRVNRRIEKSRIALNISLFQNNSYLPTPNKSPAKNRTLLLPDIIKKTFKRAGGLNHSMNKYNNLYTKQSRQPLSSQRLSLNMTINKARSHLQKRMDDSIHATPFSSFSKHKKNALYCIKRKVNAI